MDLDLFEKSTSGALVPISGVDPRRGAWSHMAFVPNPLEDKMPQLSPDTYLAVSAARASLAALDATSKQLPNPTLLRLPTLRREAQSTSALEGTYAPLEDVLTADEDAPSSPELVEVMNYVNMANQGFDSIARGFPITVSFITGLQGQLMRGTQLERVSGQIRDQQVVIGIREEAIPEALPVHRSRFVPTPPGLQLHTGMQDLVDWMRADHSASIDPVVAAAMSHYQFESLHPFMDGNGRVGRYLIVLTLLANNVLSEPTLTVSPWFEARRSTYYDRLFGVSSAGDWDAYVRFFAQGLQAAADATQHQMFELVAVQAELKDRLRASHLRADTAHALVDLAVANPSFTVKKVETDLNVSYQRANRLVQQLRELEILEVLDENAYKKRYFSPSVLAVLVR
ncbi:Fic family protein [Leucobacter sp. BZR 635]